MQPSYGSICPGRAVVSRSGGRLLPGKQKKKAVSGLPVHSVPGSYALHVIVGYESRRACAGIHNLAPDFAHRDHLENFPGFQAADGL